MSETPRQQAIKVNDVTLQVYQAGPEEGPLVILLHGFPENWQCWESQIQALAAQGYRVWAPDQRGYGLSEGSFKVADYRSDILAADIIGLIDHAGEEKALIAGHDWGGAVAWWLASHYPERVEKVMIFNVPHPEAFRQTAFRMPGQILKSWYMLFFQLPWLPQKILALGDYFWLRRQLRTTTVKPPFPDALLNAYLNDWRQAGTMHKMINWYRAALQHPVAPRHEKVSVPLRLVWGKQDSFLKPVFAEKSMGWCTQGSLHWLPEASHWILHEEPEACNQHLIDFFSE